MPVLVINCFHWIGFHITNQLLEIGCQVEGINNNSSEKSANLSLYIGRNSLFKLISLKELNKYDTVINIGESKDLHEIDTKRTILISDTERTRNEIKNVTFIRTPLLFGEWMPMNREGVYYLNEHIPFDSELFLTQSIYIKDFTESLVQILKMNKLPSTLVTQSVKNSKSVEQKLDKSLFIRDNVPIGRNVEKLLEHFQRFRTEY